MQKGMGDGQGYKTAFLSMQLSEFSAPAYLLFHFVRCRDRRILLYCHFSFCVCYLQIDPCWTANDVCICNTSCFHPASRKLNVRTVHQLYAIYAFASDETYLSNTQKGADKGSKRMALHKEVPSFGFYSGWVWS